MKKLIIRDHLGEVILSKDVYMEGQDFVYIAPAPTAMWVKEIYICSLEDTEKYVLTKEEAQVLLPEEKEEVQVEELEPPFTTQLTITEKIEEKEVKPRETEEIIEDIHETIERIKEVTSESETICDSSAGDRRIDKAEQLEGIETTSKSDPIGDAVKRNKRYRQPKAASDTLGGGSKQRTSKSRRGKAKETNIKEG